MLRQRLATTCLLLLFILGGCGIEIETPAADDQAETTTESDSDADGSTSQFEPDVYEPDIFEPDISEPVISEPVISEPVESEPVVSEPSVSEPSVSGPSVSGPSVSGAESERTEGPTATPQRETAEMIDGETAYEELVSRFGEDYASCEVQTTLQSECEAPAGLTGDTVLQENINVQLILDSSGSMAEVVGGEPKLVTAQEALTEFVDQLPAEANVALRVYGHNGSNDEAGRPESCAGTELLYPFEPLDAPKFKTVIESFEPRGWTPIANSLQAASTDFANFDPATSTNFVYLVSDGIETCDGDPVAAARELHESDIQVTVNVIGFDVDAEAAQQLQDIAAAGGGEYLAANSRDELQRIFRETYSEAWSYYRCVYNQQYANYRSTYNDQYDRYRCTYNKAYDEYRNIYDAAYEHYRNDEFTREARDTVISKARDKRDTLIEEARQQRDEIINTARDERDTTIEDARDERDETIEDARDERDIEDGNN